MCCITFLTAVTKHSAEITLRRKDLSWFMVLEVSVHLDNDEAENLGGRNIQKRFYVVICRKQAETTYAGWCLPFYHF